ncbi:MAG: hypothetical protein FJ100_04620 [Deltaproteobacteria bacterium]|nr:hypothetical protein [Deltaproteobacteria bacterium]
MYQAEAPDARQTRLGAFAVLLIPALVSSACLSTSYEVPRDEVERLVQLPVDQRGKAIRAVQRFSVARDLTPAPAWGQPGGVAGEGPPVVAAPVTAGAPCYTGWYPDYYGWGNPYYGPRLWIGGGSSSVETVAPAGGSAPRVGSSGSGGSALGSVLGKADRDSARAVAAAIITAAIVMGAVMAVSEGARYDGTVAVHPHHPVHLLGSSGDRIVALDELQLGELRDDEAVILEGSEGAGMWLRGRGPLNRPGFTYSMGGGYAGLQLRQGALVSGGSAELGLGAFLSDWLGLLWRTQFIDGVQSGGDFIGIRSGAEVQAIPLALGRLHLGGYGSMGYEFAKAGGGALPFTDDNRLSFGGGAVVEFEWTTRLAVYFRYGLQTALVGGDTGTWMTGGALGLNIY